MTNQPKKYKKFLSTAATASLVASAIVPAVSAASTFPDVDAANSHAENISALVEAGIINGYEDGTFKPNAELTRGQVVKMLGKWVESQGFEFPADYNTVQRFDDVAVDAVDQELVKYAALVKDNGIFIGTDGNLNAADSITRENMALTFDRAYKVVYGKSLVELAAGSESLTVADLAAAKEEARGVIQALRNIGISNVDNFQPKKTVTRAQFASFLNRTLNASAKPAAEVTIKSLAATAVSQLTVEFDGAVTSADTAKFTVTRGTTAITVGKVEWNDEKTKAVITVDHKFSDGTYSLTVSGVAKKDLTASVTTSREEVSDIHFLSNKLVFTGKTKGDYNQAVIAFEALNQYGEDITKNINANRFVDERVRGIDVNKDDITVENGKFIVWVEKDEDDDKTGSVEFTYKNGDFEIDVNQDVQLSDISEPGSVELLSIYNSGNKELTTKNLKDAAGQNAVEEFYLLFNVKDQYGVDIDAEFADDVKSSSSTSDTTILDEVQRGIRASVSNKDIFDLEDEDKIEVMNVDGEYYFALKLVIDDPEDLVGGENIVEFRAKATGEITSKTYTVEHSSEVYEIKLSSPGEVIAGDETVKLPVTATDQNGELITDIKALNEDLKDEKIIIDWDSGLTKLSGKASSVFTFVKEKEKVYLKFETADNFTDEAEDYDIDIEVDQSGIENTLTLLVEPNAHPARITSVKSLVHNYVLLGDSRDEELVLEDQYGRVFNKKSVGTAEKPGGVNGYQYYEISATSSNKDIFTVTNTSHKFVVKSHEEGSATIQFKLVARDVEGNVIEDKFDVTFRSIEMEDFDSFKVKSDKLLYGGDEFVKVDDAGIKVVGLIGDREVDIPNSKYNIHAESEYLSTDGKKVTADTATIEADDILDNETDQYKADIVVTINDTGETIRYTLTLAREDAIANSFKVNDTSGLTKKTLEEIEIEYNDVSEDLILTASEIIEELVEEGTIEIKDQYNNKPISINNSTGKVEFYDGTSDYIKPIITDIISDNDKNIVSSNGTTSMTIKLGEDGLTIGDSFNLTLTIDDKTQTIKVYIK
ncbi:S-layer homology domain-containing protein [Lysinibacillus telephonicus]|uniref:S-layer homology domain-containing protein n=1 Tax=Lysinibacillus telephonicus TaxID=1714840 RepID=UPI0039786ED0